jgi:serine/threonine protein phosphatase PrpC
MIIFSTSLQGARDANEDQHIILLNSNGEKKDINAINLFGVFDGHGGAGVSTYLRKELYKYFFNKKLEIKFPVNKKNVIKIFDHLQNKLKDNYKKIAYNSGSTCLIIIHFIENNKEYLQVFNVGDSRAILCRNNIAIPLTKDHKPNWYEERRRIEELNQTTEFKNKIYFDGHDWRIGDLSVSRAFGDIDATPYVTHIPDIFKYKLNQADKFIVLACDGLWDVMSNQDVVNFILDHFEFTQTNNTKDIKIYNNPNYDLTDTNSQYSSTYSQTIQTIQTVNTIDESNNIARKLAEYAIAKGSTDNVSIVIVFFC